MASAKKSVGEEKRTTNLSKFLKILRIQNDEVLGDMAANLGIMPSYLSSIESNRRPLTQALQQKLAECYDLSEEKQKELEGCVAEAARSVEVSLENVKDEAIFSEYVDTALMFARDLSSLGSTELNQIKQLLKSFNTEGNDNEKRNLSKSKGINGEGV